MDRLYRYHAPANAALCIGIAIGLLFSFWGPFPAVGGFLAGVSVGILLMAAIHC